MGGEDEDRSEHTGLCLVCVCVCIARSYWCSHLLLEPWLTLVADMQMMLVNLYMWFNTHDSISSVQMISAEAPVLFAKAAQIFITELTLRAWIHTEDNKRRTLQVRCTQRDIWDKKVLVVCLVTPSYHPYTMPCFRGLLLHFFSRLWKPVGFFILCISDFSSKPLELLVNFLVCGTCVRAPRNCIPYIIYLFYLFHILCLNISPCNALESQARRTLLPHFPSSVTSPNLLPQSLTSWILDDGNEGKKGAWERSLMGEVENIRPDLVTAGRSEANLWNWTGNPSSSVYLDILVSLVLEEP